MENIKKIHHENLQKSTLCSSTCKLYFLQAIQKVCSQLDLVYSEIFMLKVGNVALLIIKIDFF